MSDGASYRRRLLFFGILLVLLFLLEGIAVPAFTNPRMGVAAHVGGLLSGVLLAVIGLAWGDLHLSLREEKVAYHSTLWGLYGSSGLLVLAAIFGTSRSTPLAGAGHTGAPWQELLVDAGLVLFAVLLLVGCVLCLIGLRRPR